MDIEKVAGWGIGALTLIIGGWDMPLQILLIFMCADLLTGIIKALYKGAFTSKSFREGLMGKAGFIVAIILCYQVDMLLGNATPLVRTAGAIFYIGVEGSSIIENLGQMGVPIPKILSDKLARLNENETKENK